MFFPSNEETVVGNILKDDFEKMWDSPFMVSLRSREILQDCIVDNQKVGCSSCPDKLICGGCRARAYGYFGDGAMPDIGCVHNKLLWEKTVEKSAVITC